jgi:hypothetical protein
MANFNVACYFPGCTNPVTGQCGGYNQNCLKFYCTEHSNNGLCLTCSEHKLGDEIYAEYTNSIVAKKKNLPKEANRTNAIVIIIGAWLLGGVFINIAAQNPNNKNVVLLAFCFVSLLDFGTLAASTIAYQSRKKRIWDTWIKNESQTKPGFSQFFEKWAIVENKKQYEQRKAVAFGIAAAIIGATISAAANGMSSDSEEAKISRAVDDELRRRGL